MPVEPCAAGDRARGFVIGMSWPIPRLGRRFRATIGDWETVSQDPRPPIVYLRPFEADGVEYVTSLTGHVRARPARRLLGETTYEQRLARAQPEDPGALARREVMEDRRQR